MPPRCKTSSSMEPREAGAVMELVKVVLGPKCGTHRHGLTRTEARGGERPSNRDVPRQFRDVALDSRSPWRNAAAGDL